MSAETMSGPPEARTVTAIRSPFVAVYELGDAEGPYDDPLREAYSSIANELYDEEFDETLFELLADARNLHQDQLSSGHSSNEADQLVTQRFSQLVTESEAMVDAMAKEFGARSEVGIAMESEIESFVERYLPSGPIEPAFENFFGKLLKKVGRAAKAVAGKAWQGLKKIGLGPVLRQIKALIKPLLHRVLQQAIGKLPVAIRPGAQRLAEKLGFRTPKPPQPQLAAAGGSAIDSNEPASVDAMGSPVQDVADGGLATTQQEFDEQIAEAVLAQNEAELNLEVARVHSNMAVAAAPVFADLDDARERFIRELDELKSGESAEPHIQNFLPAVLPALRLGFRLIGKPHVVAFLARLLSRLISRMIGPEQAPALSRAIVDAGLRLLNLEMSEQEQSRLAPSAVVATVEDAVYRVASLPNHILDNQELLEGFALEAFEQAAAANLPAVLSSATYQRRPELLEGGINAAWLLMPLRGRKRYKRCSQVFKVRITPQMADEVESFEGVPLSDYLQDQLGLPEGADVEADVHLYEVLPGATSADIAQSESEAVGLGASDEATVSQLHPLTERAASTLLGKPGLGRRLPFDSDRQNLAAGQRLFHVAIRGRRPLRVANGSARPRARRPAQITVTLDAPQDQIRVRIFISETKAQRLAVRLRQQIHPGSLSVGFYKFVAGRLGPILRGHQRRRLRIVQPGLLPNQSPEAVLQRLPGIVPQAFISKMQQWLVHGFSEFVKTQAPQFLAATENPADGVTLRFTIEHPQGLRELGQALVEKGPAGSRIADVLSRGSPPTTRVEVFPGHRGD